ncbi:unnamed protein product [Bursaphelenchus xylophilus]|uniref:(pine wood nematode) hypothetical protein n=1 Tax=Bursaphelenchus xylophilus TaxID=6326 RepID=A0A1I7SCS7_BURXY|nr:unnamed protein product [Bursaphelenchus xylophilus]CAG9093579.1 unnamed protein product [Bursaphelenchus xylophilus]
MSSGRRSSSRSRRSGASRLRFDEDVEVIPPEGESSFRRSPSTTPRRSSGLSRSARAKAMPRDARGRFLPLNDSRRSSYRKTPVPTRRYSYRLSDPDKTLRGPFSDSEADDVVEEMPRRSLTRGRGARDRSSSSSSGSAAPRRSRRSVTPKDTPRPPRYLSRRGPRRRSPAAPSRRR